MKKYNKPMIDVLLFDEDEDVLTVSKAAYSADQLNKYMYDNVKVNSTTTIKIQDISINSSATQ